VADRLDAKGLFAPGIRPGPAAARLLEIGSITRTITLGGAVFDADGRAATDERTRVIVQAGGVNLLFDARGGMIRLEEIDGARMLEAMQEAFLTPAHRELIHPD
jgi:high-affinity nickel permease